MTCFAHRSAVTALMVFAFSAALSARASEPSGVRDAVTASLPYIAERGQWWIDAKKCVSCHRTAFTVWAHVSAADAGFDIDREQLNAWVDWSFESMLKQNDKEIVVATTNLDGTAQMLHATRTLTLTETQVQQRDELLKLLQEGQQDDGSWKPAGQLPSQKRPKDETTYVTTAWNRWQGDACGLKMSSSEKALAFLNADQEFTSTESLVVRLLNTPDADGRQQVAEMIFREQNKDGGWGWIRLQESDAMATGQVLYAMSSIPNSAGAETAIESARQYLVTSQKPDGTWAVKGTKKNRKDKVQETSTYWGTCWAVIGLLESEKTKRHRQPQQDGGR